MARPIPLLAPVAVGWLLGLLAGAHPALAAARVPCALLALGVGIAAAVARRRTSESLRRVPRWAWALGLGAVGAGLAAAHPPPAPRAPAAGLLRLQGRVERVDHGTRGPSSVLRVERASRVGDDEPVAVPFRARVYDRALPAGAQVRVLARVRPITRFRNPSPHPEWPKPRPIVATAKMPEGARVRVLARAPLPELLERARTRVRRALEQTLNPRAAGVARALVLGEGRAVDPEDRQAVRGAGLAHVLAVSGLHVALVAGLLVTALARLLLFVPAIAGRLEVRRLAAAFGPPLAMGYALLAGSPPSAWRAAITASIAWVLVAAGRRPRPAAVAAAAALVLSAAQPSQALRPAFLLSILAVAAILTTSLASDSGWVRAAFRISARTTVATAPLVLWCFGHVPLAGLAANVVLVPVGSLLLVPLAIGHAAAATALPALAPATAALLEAVTVAFVTACEAFAALPFGDDLPPPSLLQGLVLTVGAAAVLLARRWRHRLAVALLAVLALAGAELWLRHTERPRGVLRATTLDVGQGDATLLDLPDGRAMLIDAGGAVFGGPDPGARALLPLLQARRRDRLAVVVITHAHPDHWGGLEALIGHVHIGEVWTSGQALAERPEGPLPKLLARLEARGIPVRRPESLCGRVRRFGTAEARVLHPCPTFDAGYPPNDNSLVVRVGFGARSMLFSGDIEADGEGVLLARGAYLRADVLKVPHHGSRTSSTEAFLRAVSPELALVSCGRYNRFGHPHDAAIARLEQADATVLRTDRRGGLVVVTDGRTLETRAPSPR